jgi:hypothetical protein
MTDKTYFYIEYMDGTSDYRLPKEWHETVGKVEGYCRCYPRSLMVLPSHVTVISTVAFQGFE